MKAKNINIGRTDVMDMEEPAMWLRYVDPVGNDAAPATVFISPEVGIGTSEELRSDDTSVAPLADGINQAAFTTGNIVVYRVGTKGGTAALTTVATAVFLDEYRADGTLVQSIELPTTDNGANQTLTAAGNATTEGMLTRSVDGRFLVLTGYDAAVGTATVAGTATTSVVRVIGRVAADGTIDTTTTTTSYSAGTIRGAVSIDGSQFWETGSNGGVVYQTFGSSGAATSIATPPANDRAINIFGGQLYISSGSASYIGVSSVGVGTPTVGNQAVTLLTGTNSTNPYQFFFADLTDSVAGIDTLYVADSVAANGLEKFSLVNGAWALNGKITTPTGMIGLTGSTSGSTASLYLTTASGIYALTDSAGYNAANNGSAAQIAAASANTAFRGIAFAPQAAGTATETIAFQTAPITQNEGNGANTTYTYTLTRTGSTVASATVGYTVQTGANTTTSANDFISATSGTATFAAGSATTTVTVIVAGDQIVENDETFVLALSGPSGGYVVSAVDGARTSTIVNDDSSFAIAAGSAAEDAGGVPFQVTRTGDLSRAATLSYAVSLGAGDTASASDFPGGTLPQGTVSFAAGAATTTITVPVAGDSVMEGDETFTVTLSGADQSAGQTIATAAATGTIVNDELPTLSIADANVIEGNDGTILLQFTVTASAPAPTGGFTFQASTANGTATAGSDYTALVGTQGSIAAGQTSTVVTVVVNGDTIFERNETLTVTLSNPTGATVATGQATGIIVNDDATPASARLFATDFAGFAAAGFSPGAAAASGQLDSNMWRVVGLSAQPNPAYGFTGPGGNTTAATDDFGRGIISGDPVSAGVYTPAGDRALIFQPTGAELDAGGFIETRILNSSGATATGFDVAFDWAYRNNAARSSNLQLAYSTDGVNFTVVQAASFSTPGTADNTSAVFSNQRETVTIDGTVADGGYLYLRWIHASSTGGGSRDEVGIDNLTVDARLSDAPTASIADITVAEGDSGQGFATFTIIRSNGTTTASVDYATANGTATASRDYLATRGTVSFAVGETSKTIQVAILGDTVREANETFTVTLSNANGFSVPQPRATATIVNDDQGPVAIYDIQGLGHTSAFAGQTVATSGVVTALATNGFYLQDPNGDGDVGTSDGIFVFTNAAPTVSVGNAITLSGTVTETRGHNGALTLTQLTNPTVIAVTAATAALPTAVLISTDGTGRAAPTQVIDDDGLSSYDPTTDGVDFYESLEGMLVTIQTPRVVADTTSVGVTYVVASDGVGATGLNSRSGMTISAGDSNPETIQIFRGSNGAIYTQGDTLHDVTGVLTYFSSASTSSGTYQVNPTVTTTLLNDAPPLPRETTTLVGDVSRLSYASFNVENLAPVPDATNPDRDTQAEVDAAFARHAAEIVNALGRPDVIGLQEIQDADGAGAGTDLSGAATAAKLIAAIAAAGGPTYAYVEVTPTANTGGQPNGYIRPGFLYNPERATYVAGSARVLTDAVYDGTRRPLIADFQFNGQTFTAIDLHSTSRGGSSPLYGSTQPPTQAGDAARTAQAQAVKTYVDGVLANDPGHLFVVNGDFNGFYYETALQALAPVNGSGALSNLILKLPVEERYTYYFDGYYQSFDNVIVSSSLYAGSSFDIVHYNAGYNDGLSATDHDQPIALIGLARSGGTAIAVADGFATTAIAVYGGTVLANDTGGDASLVVTAVNGDATAIGQSVRLASGALVTLLAGGSFAYDPDGAFSGLAAGATGTDRFTYTISGGSTATATITVTGVASPTPDANGHLNGTAGNDSFGGTTNADYFDLSSGGTDQVAGGAAADAFFFGSALTAADRVNGGSGIDEVGIQGDYTGANRLVLSATTLDNVELLAALPGGSYDLTLNSGVIGNAGAFTIYGSNLGAGDAFIVDGSAVASGSLTMHGGLGVDTLTGGAGDDGFLFGPDRWGAGDVVHGGAGNDALGLDGNYTLALDGRMDVEVVALLAGPEADRNTFAITIDDSFVAAGDTKTIYAATVTTALSIDASGETNGSLRIFGGFAGDTITGGGAADRIFGGMGADTLRGGGGADVFVYDDARQSTGTGYDRLLDFDYETDRIEIASQVHDSYANVAGGTLRDASFDTDLQAAVGGQLASGSAVFFTPDAGEHVSQTFLIVDANGIAGYQAGGDYVFQMASPPPGQPTDFIIG